MGFLRDAVALSPDKVLDREKVSLYGGISPDTPVLVILAAGKGTRFGQSPKCIQPVSGVPLARHSIDSFRRFSPSPVICLVGYRHEEVSAALGNDNVYVRSDNPAGGTAFASFEAFSVPGLVEANPLLVVTMGDRIVPPSIFLRLHETHRAGREADLTFLSAVYEPPRNRGKGRVLRDDSYRVVRIIEERDILAEPDEMARQALLNLTEGNCPLYAVRAATLFRHLREVSNDNAQQQFYLTDVIEAIAAEGGEIRTITTRPADPEYDLLCSDVTQPADLAAVEMSLAAARGVLFPALEVDEAAQAVMAGRPSAQVASIARQLADVLSAISLEKLGFDPQRPIGIGISGGRLRIAFMHPDMARFFGPAWQMPIGAGSPAGDEQVVVLVQGAEDRRVHLFPTNPKYRESINSLPDSDVMYPGENIFDLNSYEQFGTKLSENLLLSLGYFSDEELERRRSKGVPIPPASLWVSSNMRRPFALVKNAIASMRTMQNGDGGAKVQRYLGRDTFRGLRLVSTGNIPQGGFSSSSAVTLATENAINALWHLGLAPDTLVHLACQAEYGTGVRAGSLDQATEQMGQAGKGTLISSNPRENYRVIGTYPVPTDRFQILFPYTVDRDRAAWRWSWGMYAETPGKALTTGETRKMTGKAAELAALLVLQPLDVDFFQRIEHDLVSDGRLDRDNRAWIASVLRKLPLLAKQAELRERALANRDWYVEQLGRADAAQRADAAIEALFAGWRDAVLRRTLASGTVVEEEGVPLRAMVAYLFGEVAKNFYLIHNPEDWIACVRDSQRGDRCVEIDPARLPSRDEMEGELKWELGVTGADRMNRWLEAVGANPFDFNRGLDDGALDAAEPPEFHELAGSNFFRGLALIDLAEAMLERAFGRDAVAVRVNAAGQGDYFQVHVDTREASPKDVKRFIAAALYRRFGLAPSPEFVEIHPGGGAVGVRLSRFDAVGQLIQRLLENGRSG
ncbi:MAG: NTP transferase domain-containing protein [Bryobacteraceae bacterium]